MNGEAAMDAAVRSAKDRKLVWIERGDFWGWGCSRCSWVFGSHAPSGESFDEVMRNTMSQCDIEFVSHPCVDCEEAANEQQKG
jgi:hypothetical protein